jgi:hypothetical protein
MNRLIVPPFPVASRPSNKMTMRVPVSFTQFCSFNCSICNSRSARESPPTDPARGSGARGERLLNPG